MKTKDFQMLIAGWMLTLMFPIQGLTQEPILVTFNNPTDLAGVGDMGNGGGSAFMDYNNDGFPDIFFVNTTSSGLNVLFHNNQDETFTDRAAELNVQPSSAHWETGVIFGDYDNDGDKDIYIITHAYNIFYQNQGSAGNWNFIDVTNDLGEPMMIGHSDDVGGAFGDFDNDGDLDIWFTGHEDVDILENNGNGTFTYRTIADMPNAHVFGTAVGDYDNDGDLDVYIADGEYAQRNYLFRNDGNFNFTEVADAANVAGGNFSSPGAAWGDFNNDGWLDLYVTNYGAGAGPDGENNFLFQNNGDGTFTDVTTAKGVGGGTRKSNHVTWADFNDDGYLDIYVQNTNIGNPPGNNQLFLNKGPQGNWTFVDRAFEAGVDDDMGRERGSIITGDYNRDGRLDIYVVAFDNLNSLNAKNTLYKSEGPAIEQKWLHVKLIGTTNNRDAIGARVIMVAGSLSMVREVTSGEGAHSHQNSLPVEFGLGSNTVTESILITWPIGNTTTLANINANQMITVLESGTIQKDMVLDNTYGDIYVSGDVTVALNVTLTIQPQTVLKFVNGAKLVINGTLNAQGTVSEPILFTSVNASPQKSDWYGIKASNSAHINLQYTTIEYADYGVHVEFEDFIPIGGHSVTIDECTIQNSTYGIYATEYSDMVTNTTFESNKTHIYLTSSSNPAISGNDFVAGTYGIRLYTSSRATITGNDFSNTKYPIRAYNSNDTNFNIEYNTMTSISGIGFGIYLNNASPRLQSNTIDNYYLSLYCYNNSTPEVRSCSFTNATYGLYCKISSPFLYESQGINAGYNTFDGDSYGVFAWNNSFPNLGVLVGAGNNSFLTITNKLIWNGNTSGNISAVLNWWNSPSGPDTYKFYPDASRIDYIPFLNQPPGSMASGGTIDSTLEDDVWALNHEGMLLISEGKFAEAAVVFESVIDNFPDNPAVNFAAVHLSYSLSRIYSFDEVVLRLDAVYDRHEMQAVQKILRQLSLPYLEKVDKFPLALGRIQMLLAQHPGDIELREHLMFEKGNILKYELKRAPQARAAYQNFLEEFPESELSEITLLEIEELKAAALGKEYNPLTQKSEENIPKQYVLYQNYPNPFNPITTIRFDIPEAREVELVIYDIIGREVETLVSGKVVSGRHEVIWDATNMGSGVYFYRLVVRQSASLRMSYTNTKKLIVLK